MTEIKIRKLNLSDIENLKNIAIETFYQTFSHENTKENMDIYLNTAFSIDKLKEELSNPNSEFYFSEINNQAIGYIKINFSDAQTEIKYNNSLEIERIYVLKNFHGKNIGQILLNKVFEIGKNNNIEYIWLGVSERNIRAVNFYKKNNFIEFDKHIFKLGDDEQIDLMMKCFNKFF